MIMQRVLYLSVALLFVQVSESQALPLSIYETGAKQEVCTCDFSSYKPLVLSHPLVNAALTKVDPDYPAIAKDAKAQGRVGVRILVNRNGDVIDACVSEGHPLLGPAARSAALQWKFKKNFGFTKKQKKRYIEASLFFTFRLDS